MANQDTLDHLKILTDHFEIIDGDDNGVTDNYYQFQQQAKEDFSGTFHFDQSLVYIEEEQAQELTLFEESDGNNNNASGGDDNIDISEVVLSQRLSQLSTTATTKLNTTDSPQKSKRFRPKSDHSEGTDRMPYYLLAENRKFFDPMFEHNIHTDLDKEEVRQLAYLIHYRAYYEQLYYVWSIYLQAGTGKLKADQSIPIHRRYWPTDVKTALKDLGVALPTPIMKEDEHLIIENFVDQRMLDYDSKIKSYQQQADEKKYWLKESLTQTMEQAVETLVQQYGTTPFRMKCDFTLNTLDCDYDDHLLLYEYEQEKPTAYQRDVFERVYDTNFKLESTKDIYLAYRQRILYNRPLISYDALEISLPVYLTSLSDPVLRQQYRDDYELLIQQTKIDLMVVRLAAIEVNIHQYEQIYQQEKTQMLDNYQRKIADKVMTPALLRLVEQRAKIMMKKIQVRRHFLFNYYLRSPYGQFEAMTKGKMDRPQRMGFPSNLIIDPTVTISSSKLSDRQRHLLNRGPTYVAPCQMQAASSFQSIDTVVAKQYAPLHDQLAILFDKYSTNPLQASNVPKKIKEEFRGLFSTVLPKAVCERAINEQKLIQSIQQQFNQDHLLLRRTADQKNVFYLMDKNSFEEKCHNYMKQTEDRYELLYALDGTNQQEIRFQLDRKILTLNNELEKVFKANKSTEKLYPKLRLKLDEMQLSYLYFLPDLSSSRDQERPMSVKPMFSSYQSLTWKLANYLYRLLQPFVTSVMGHTMIVSESDFMEKFHQYCHYEGRLHPTTLFASIQITNFHTTFSTEHQYISGLFGFFLKSNTHVKKPELLSVSTIENLIESFVQNNLFYYDGKIYRFRKGAPNSMHFSELLSNVHIFLWQKKVFDDTRLKTELFVRYKDQIFFTWNHPESDLHTFLNTIKKENEQTFQINFSFGRSVNYLNIHLENRSGRLYTCLYHPTKSAQLRLPYVVGHAKINHSRWFRSALIRTVQISSDYQDFNQERIYLEMSCLLAGYSTDLIDNELKKFYHSFDINAYRFDMNERIYERLRRRLLDFINIQRRNETKDMELDNQERLIRLYYLYDYGPYHQFREKIADIWSKYVQTHSKLTPYNIKIILNAKHIFSLHTLLAEQKPSCALLL